MNETKYLHYRYSDADGRVYARGGVTVAYTQTAEGTIKVATARCHLNDNFVKVAGRNKAGGRLKSPRFAQEFKGSEAEFLERIEADIAKYNYFMLPETNGELTLSRKYSGKQRPKALTNENDFGLVINTNNQSGGITAAVVNA